ncbi:50S ribosomal protein L15, partial [bacterium]
FKSGETVNREALRQKGLVENSKAPVKVLGKGTLAKKLDFEGLQISASAKGQIEKAGGKLLEETK